MWKVRETGRMDAFIFDMDGVLVDSEPIHSRTKLETLQHFGLFFDERELVHYMGRTTKALFSDVLAASARQQLSVDEMVAYKHACYLAHLRQDDSIQPIAGTRKLLEALREIKSRTGHFGEAPPPPEWMPMLSLIAWVGKTARAALAEVGE